MSYTPVELRHVRVGRSVFGYNRAMVEEMIEEVAESFEATWRERGELADRVESLEKYVLELRGREELLTRTLVAAEQVATDIRRQARDAADAILAEAQRDAQAIVRTAHAHREVLHLESRRIEGMLRAALVMIEEETAPANAAPMPFPMPTAPVAAQAAAAPSEIVQPETLSSETLSSETVHDSETVHRAQTAHAPETTQDAAAPAPAAAPVGPAQLDPRLVEPELERWPHDETGEFKPVNLPPAVEDAGSEEFVESKPLLRRLVGGTTRDFDWGD